MVRLTWHDSYTMHHFTCSVHVVTPTVTSIIYEQIVFTAHACMHEFMYIVSDRYGGGGIMGHACMHVLQAHRQGGFHVAWKPPPLP